MATRALSQPSTMASEWRRRACLAGLARCNRTRSSARQLAPATLLIQGCTTLACADRLRNLPEPRTSVLPSQPSSFSQAPARPPPLHDAPRAAPSSPTTPTPRRDWTARGAMRLKTPGGARARGSKQARAPAPARGRCARVVSRTGAAHTPSCTYQANTSPLVYLVDFYTDSYIFT